MMKQHIEALLHQSLETLNQQGVLQGVRPAFQVEATKDKQHGDFACNVALSLAKSARMKPRDLAEAIVRALPSSTSLLNVEIAGPGFINFFVSEAAFFDTIKAILAAQDQYGKTTLGQGKKVIVEFVSSNPTGPLHVGHGRHAAYGAVVANLLTMMGYAVHREYYINDAGRQMDILAVSIWLRYLALLGESIPFPVNGYQGAYGIEIAKLLVEKERSTLWTTAEKVIEGLPFDEHEGGDKEAYIDAMIARAKKIMGEKNYQVVLSLALEYILSDIRSDLAEFGVYFDEWFSERAFVQGDRVDRMIEQLKVASLVYQKEGALWFRSTDFEDEKDRVLLRANGQKTYFANDLAYHLHKFERGFDLAIDIFGSDHHGYVPRMKAGLKACGISPDQLTYLLVQFVTLYRKGQQVQMSTRSGSFVTLRELRHEVGNDAARFFYVMRKSEQHMDFDLDLAKAESNENPVYYVQYAHARICSVLRQLAEKGLRYDQALGVESLALLVQPQELQLFSTLARYTETLQNAALRYEPSLLTQYLRELANDFHVYYNAHPFLVEDDSLRHARLTLILATRQLLVNGLRLLGVSTPESM